MNERLARQLVRDRVTEAEARLRRNAEAHSDREAPPPGGAVRQAFVVRDLGRLALVCALVMLLGIGVVGLWTAATEPRPPRLLPERLLR
jgi:hypothetical protein